MIATLQYYLGAGWQFRALPHQPSGGITDDALRMIRADVSTGQRFWLVYSRPRDGDPDGRLRDELRKIARLQLSGEWSGVQLYEGRGW